MTHMMTETPTPVGDPLVIVPGADGTMWFTEGASPGAIASINPITRAITSFETPTAGSGPIGAAPGSDGNVWFGENSVAKVGRVGVGAARRRRERPSGDRDGTVGPDPDLPGRWLLALCNGQQLDIRVRLRRLPLAARRQPHRRRHGTDTVGAALPPTPVTRSRVRRSRLHPPLTTTVPTTSAPVTISSLSLGASLVSTQTTPTTLSSTIMARQARASRRRRAAATRR